MISVIGTLPPVKGLSAYTLEFLKALAACNPVDFIGFKKLYPEVMYPGGTVDHSSSSIAIRGVKQRNFLTWYNPFGWIWAGLTARGMVVHAQWWSYVLAPVFTVILGLARLRGLPVVLTVHNVSPHERSWLKDLLNSSVFWLSNRFVVHSEHNKRALVEIYGIDDSRVHVIPHGVLITPGLEDVSRHQARARLGLSLNERVILAFGAIRDYKGIDVLIKAFKRIDVKDKKLIVAGKCWEDSGKYISLIGGDKSILLHDRFIPGDEIAFFFRAADLVVLPYKYFDSASGVGGMVIPYHLPMIVSSVGSLPELVLDHENCVVEPGNVDELALKMQRIISDGNLRAKLAEDAGLIEERFGWDSIVTRTMDVYAAVTAGGS